MLFVCFRKWSLESNISRTAQCSQNYIAAHQVLFEVHFCFVALDNGEFKLRNTNCRFDLNGEKKKTNCYIVVFVVLNKSLALGSWLGVGEVLLL